MVNVETVKWALASPFPSESRGKGGKLNISCSNSLYMCLKSFPRIQLQSCLSVILTLRPGVPYDYVSDVRKVRIPSVPDFGELW